MASASAVSAAKKHSEKELKSIGESPAELSKNTTLLPVLAGLQVPEPMFFCTVEPLSAAYQKGCLSLMSYCDRLRPYTMTL